MKVGIPRALFYYYYFPLWKTFFQKLGVDVVLSPPTSKAIVNSGLRLAVDEACLPIKVFYGHIDYLLDKIDLLFMPRLVSIAPKEYICPKFMGLPDMIKANFKNLPPVINVTVDRSKEPEKVWFSALEAGKYITSDQQKIANAWNEALQKHREYRKLNKNRILPEEGLQILFENHVEQTDRPLTKLKIGLLGHGYTIFDPCISMQLIKRLQTLGAEIITPENLEMGEISRHAAKLPKRMFWTLGKKMLGSTLYWLDKFEVDGIIYVAAFGCGPDSLVGDLVERYCRKNDFPFLNLTVDEHTGEAGVTTRIEAFVDLLEGKMAQ